MPKPPIITRVSLPQLVKYSRGRPLMGKQQKATTLSAIKQTGYGDKAAGRVLRGAQDVEKRKAKKIINQMHKSGIKGLSLGGDRVVNRYVDVMKAGGPITRAEKYMRKRIAMADKAMEKLRDRKDAISVDLTPRWEQAKQERTKRYVRPGLTQILANPSADSTRPNGLGTKAGSEKNNNQENLIQKWQAAKKIAEKIS